MRINTNNHYQQLVDMGLSNEEKAEVFILLSELSGEEQKESYKEVSEFLKRYKKPFLNEDFEGIFID